jgi:hypothetical protein
MKKLRSIEVERYYKIRFSYFDLVSCFLSVYLGLIFGFHLIHAHAYAKSCHMSVLTIPRQKKALPNIYGIRIVGGSRTQPRSQF